MATIKDVARAAGVHPATASRALNPLLRGRRCEGYIVATAVLDDPAVAALARDGVPLVLVNRLTGVPAPAVVSDDARGIGEAVEHLRALGHTRIGHVAGPAELSVAVAREAAYRAAVDEPLVVRAAQMTAAAGRAAGRELLGRGVTAILAANDMIAVGCYAALDDAGLRCPLDVSLVGINDMPLAAWLRPPLSTVAIPQEELGAAAARLVIERIGDPGAAPQTVSLPTGLVVRGSTARSEQRIQLGP